MREARRRAAVRRRNFIGGLIATVVVFFVIFSLVPSSGGIPASTDDEITVAAAAGTEAGNAVVALKSNSMARERAVLAIRARESQLRNAGFTSAADAYADAAEKVMKDAGLLE